MEERRLGRYRITSKLAEGGMGAVYLATHELMEREVVIKVLLPEMSTQREIVQRFFNEARATGNLNHPGIVAIFDLDYADDGRAYIVMERLQGETLHARLKRVQRLSVEHTIDVLRQLASAVGAAHERGIVHRDLKPANIFLVQDPEVPGRERVKVLDFGVAKLAQQQGSLVTHQGTIFGTPQYMAPEQCLDAATVDHRADIYALGCILYECLCGRPPFQGGAIEVLAAQLRDVPAPPRALNTSLPPWLDSLAMQLLQKEPGNRLQSCAALNTMLDGNGRQWAGQLARDASTYPPMHHQAESTSQPQWTQAGGYAAGQSAVAPTAHDRVQSSPTTGSIVGSAAELQTGNRKRKGGIWLGLGGAALALFALGLYLELSGAGPDTPASGEPGAGAQPDATAIAAIDAAREPVATAGSEVEALLDEAEAALKNREWSVAIIKGRELQKLAGADQAAVQGAQQVIDRAAAEEAAQTHSEALQQAAEREDYAKLREHLAAIDEQSVYYEGARAAHDRARDAYVAEVTERAQALSKVRKCDEIRRLRAEAQDNWPEVLDEQLGKILNACRPAKRPTVSIGDQPGLTPAPIGDERAPTRSFEELVTEAEEAGRKGLFGQARRLCSQALKLKPRDDRATVVCAVAACNLGNQPSAQRYYDIASSQQVKGQIHQICRSKGIEVGR